MQVYQINATADFIRVDFLFRYFHIWSILTFHAVTVPSLPIVHGVTRWLLNAETLVQSQETKQDP
jgi:hypothetical protein